MICKSHPLLNIKQLDYAQEATLSWFEPLACQPWAMILRSAAQDHPDNRFDILVADPLATLETHGDITRIKFSNGDEKKPATLTLSRLWKMCKPRYYLRLTL